MATRLKQVYDKDIKPALVERFGYANTMAVPRIEKIVLNMGVGDAVAPPDDGGFDLYHPGNVSPLVAYLAADSCPFTGGVFHVGGNEVGLYGGWHLADDAVITADGRFTAAELAERAPALLDGRRSLASVSTSVGDTMKKFGRRKEA